MPDLTPEQISNLIDELPVRFTRFLLDEVNRLRKAGVPIEDGLDGLFAVVDIMPDVLLSTLPDELRGVYGLTYHTRSLEKATEFFQHLRIGQPPSEGEPS